MNVDKYIKNEFKDCNDLVCKKIKINLRSIHLYYLETVSSSDRINDFILKSLSNKKFLLNINKNIPSPHLEKITNKKNISYYLCKGFCIFLFDNNIYAIETKANLDRSISEPTTETSLYGSKDSFCENIQKNLGLIKRRLSNSNLKNIVEIIGKQTKTITNLLYIENITDKNLVNDVLEKLRNMDVDALIESGKIKKILNGTRNPFPTLKLSERPDTIVNSLLNGKVVILIDSNPFAIILPAFLVDFINITSDNYLKPINSNFLKFLRIISFFLSILTPAYYIAITVYNTETIPLNLLLNFTAQRSNVPLPAIFEAFFMLLICDILQESDLRFPSTYGSAISILGALILGEAAVSAGIVSPIMIIIVAITFISSLMFIDTEILGGIRTWRIIFLIITSFFGLYGFSIALILMLINLISYKSLFYSYSFPIQPFDINYIKETLFSLKKNTKRSSYLTNNKTRGNI